MKRQRSEEEILKEMQRTKEALDASIGMMVAAGRLVAKGMAEDPGFVDAVIANDPVLTRADVEWFASIGRGEIDLNQGESQIRALGMVLRLERIRFN